LLFFVIGVAALVVSTMVVLEYSLVFDSSDNVVAAFVGPAEVVAESSFVVG